jgi:hypothetical protein
VCNLVRDWKAAAPMHKMADDTECAAEQRVHWIPHRNLIGGGFVRLTSRDIPACLRWRGWTGHGCMRAGSAVRRRHNKTLLRYLRGGGEPGKSAKLPR